MQKHQVLVSAIGAVAALVLTSAEAHANGRICRQLEHEARELRQIGSGASRANLERELNRVERQVRRSGCSGLRLLFGGHAKRQCRTLRANMDRLRRQVRDASFAHSPDRRLRRVEAEMRRYGCDDRNGRSRRAEVRGYQTLCVRTCDGYYFPIGFATPKDKLERDQAACQSFYPDGAAQLYIRPSGAEEAAAMVSLDGEDYAKQPFALAYRSAYQPACADMLRAGVETAAEEAQNAITIKSSAIVPVPVPRPSLSDDETVIAQADGTVRVASAKTTTEIRVVGPATPYLVSQPADGSIAPVAANAAPKRVAPAAPGIASSWLDRIAGLIAPAAQADEGE